MPELLKSPGICVFSGGEKFKLGHYPSEQIKNAKIAVRNNFQHPLQNISDESQLSSSFRTTKQSPKFNLVIFCFDNFCSENHAQFLARLEF
jgi:hypothetical protein